MTASISEAAVRPGVSGQLGLQLFASAKGEPTSRRPTDLVLAAVSVTVVLVAAVASNVMSSLDISFSNVVAAIPTFFEPLWRLAFWVPVGWSIVLLVVAVARGRWALGRDLVLAAVLSVVLAAATAAIVMDGDRGVAALLVDADGPPVFPPGGLVAATAVISTASPHLSRPFRHAGRWLIPSQFVGAVLLDAALPSGASGAVALGLLAAATVHLAAGSPGGRPTASRIRLALAELDVHVDELVLAAMQPHGVVLFEATDDVGPLLVKVYGRDAWDAQLLANLWRLAWYRGVDSSTRLSRVELVEHEAFVTLLAERAGAHVTPIVTAGSAGRGDALVVARPIGEPIGPRDGTANPTSPTAAGTASLWHEIRRLHDGRIVHGRIDLDRVVVTSDGSLALGDLSSASVASRPDAATTDRAQALAVSILTLGEDPAVTVARDLLGDEAVIAMLPFLQDAAMPPLTRAALKDRHTDLDDVRRRIAMTLGTDEQPLIRLRRVTWASLLNLALLGLAAFALIGVLGNIDLDAFVDALADADWWWLAFGLLLAQLPRIPAAVSTMGAIDRPLPLGPLTTLQFAICYVNLAIPSTVARVAITIRFFERSGVTPVAAASAGAIDAVSGFIVQTALFLVLFLWSDLDLGLTLDTDGLGGVATIALIALIALVVFVVAALAVPVVRRRVGSIIREARPALAVLRSPAKLLQLFGGNLVGQVLFAVALGACVRAFGEELSLSSLVLIDTVVSLFAGLLPVPGGMGVSEAGLTLGLTTAGLPNETALAVAIAYRFASFYLPPIWGYVCYRWLVNRRFL